MKIFLIFPFWLFSFVQGHTQSLDVTFSFTLNTKPVIHSNKIIKEEVYTYTFKKNIIKDSVLTNIFLYDSMGDLIKEIYPKTQKYSESFTKYEYSYLPSGKLAKKIVEKSDSKMRSVYEYLYDSAGNEINNFEYTNDSSELTIEEKIYNERNQLLILVIKVNNNDPYISRKYYYNANDLAKMNALDYTGEVIYSYEYEYDKVSNKKSVYLINREGKKIEGEYFYDNNEMLIKAKTINKMVSFISGQSTEYENLNEIRENTYHPDKTIYESNVYLKDKKIQMNRHFYFKQ